MRKPKRWTMNGAAQINFTVEVHAKSAEAAWDKASDFDLQQILDNGVVTVDELELEQAQEMVRQ